MRRAYVSVVPLSSYDQYVDYVQRMFDRADAPTDRLLTADPVEFLSYSSGTTGKNKLIPTTRWSKVSIALKPTG